MDPRKLQPKVVEVISKNDEPLAPCTPYRAEQMVRQRCAEWVEEPTKIRITMTKEDKRRIRREVLERDNYTCYICHQKVSKDQATVDHIISLDYGGTELPENKACCCRECNNKKKATTLEIFRARQKEVK